MATLFDGFFQLGFVARDIDGATSAIAERFGVRQFRRKRTDWMESAHAWIGATMIEVIRVEPGVKQLYDNHIPDDPEAVRLHHHGYRVTDAAAWTSIEQAVETARWDVPMKGAVMDGHLRYMYVDTCADLGIYSEFILLSGPALDIYDDVPRN